MRRTRVLRVIARLNMGGPSHHVSLLSGRRMSQERFETLLVHGQVHVGEESLHEVAQREGVRAVQVPELVQPVSPRNDALALLKLRALIRSFQPDIVHTHTAKAGFLGRQAALSVGHLRPAIAHTYHGHVLEGYFSAPQERLYRALERWLGRHTDVLIGVSEATVADLVRLKVAEPERFRVVPLGLDLDAFTHLGEEERTSARAVLGVADDEVLVSFVGRIVPIKRLDLLLDAIAEARSAGGPVRLAIAGDGELRGELETRSRALGIDDAVTWLGYQTDLRPLAAAADIAALSSANEGTPVSLIEAAAAGLPAVATDVGGVSEVVVDGGTGILVPPDDAAALAAGVGQLAADRELRERFGAAARQRALERYSVGRLLADIEALYAELVARRPTGARI